jgi:hypothetical protein
MRTNKRWIPTTREAPAMRRILEAVRRLDSELACWDDQETAQPYEERRDGGQDRSVQ